MVPWVYRIELPPGELNGRCGRQCHGMWTCTSTHLTSCTRPTPNASAPSHGCLCLKALQLPPLTLDPERNAMYKQVQCRPTAVQSGDTGDCDAEQLVLDASKKIKKKIKRYSTPKQRVSGEDLSETAAVAFTRAFLEWQQDMKTEAAIARFPFRRPF